MGLDAEPGLVGRAFELAFQRHAGQIDKSGQPYVAHVVRVASRLTDPQDQVVGLLHDVVEDTQTSLEEIAAHFGHDVAHAVDCISKRKGETLEDYAARVASNARARRVKMADVADNSDPVRLSMLEAAQRDRLTAKYQKTLFLINEAAV